MKLLLLVSILCSACSLNGRSIGPQLPSTTTSSGSPTVSSGRLGDEEAPGAHDSHNGMPPYASAPQDPWLAVDGDQPKKRPIASWHARDTEGDCSAAHDHCFEPDMWFLVQDADMGRAEDRPEIPSSVATFSPEGTLYAGNISGTWVRENFVAYHTVPATKATLVPGATVFGLLRSRHIPANGVDAITLTWYMGTVESVELDIGVYKLKGYSESMWLSGARIPVLKWKPGGKVEIIGNKPKGSLAVRAADVFLPEK
jgi:hypothetical protein